MIVFVLAAMGAFWGGMTAHRRRGNRKDIAQYAFGFAMAFGILGMVLTIVIERIVGL